MLAEADIRKMTLKERIDVMNQLWDSLDEFPEEEIETPAWHETVLAERMRKIDAGEETFFTLEECRQKQEELKRERWSTQP